MEEESTEEPGRDLNELQNADWVGFHSPDLWPPASTHRLTQVILSTSEKSHIYLV